MTRSKYQVKLLLRDGRISYLSHMDRTCWSKSQAYKHRRDILSGKAGVKALKVYVIAY